MDITKSEQLPGGILEERFTVTSAGGVTVPGVLWTSAVASGPTPIVIVGHGGGGSKESPNIAGRRDYFTGRHGIAMVCIDAPGHGERGLVRSNADGPWGELWAEPERVVDQMVADTTATLDALLATGRFDPQAIGYYGLSLGTVFGLPYLAKERRVAAAVLGLCGTLRNPGVVAKDLEDRRSARINGSAASVQCPVLYHVQWDDELFNRDGAFELYGMIGSIDKRLQSTPGPHGGASTDAVDTLQQFLLSRLTMPVSAK